MKFFFDNTTSPSHAEAIHALIHDQGHEAVHLRSRFKPNAPDIDWLTALGKESDWIVVSGDERITRNKHERAAWLEAGLTAFFFSKGWQNMDFWVQAYKLVQRWPLLMEQADRVAPGAGFLVKPNTFKFEQVRLR